VPNGSWFLAEGSASPLAGGFSTFYLIQNANPTAASVRAYFASDDGRLIAKQFTAPARSRLTLSLGAEVGPGAFAAVFQSQTAGADISVERAMYYGSNYEVSTGERANHVLSTLWMFAEGSRGGELFDNFFLLFNAQPWTASVTMYFFRPDGVGVRRSLAIPPGQRVSYSANTIPELAGKDFSTIIWSDTGILAERTMYWRQVGTPAGTPWIGGHTSIGTAGPSADWYFAEGAASPGFETFYMLFNPTGTTASVVASFYSEGAGPLQRLYVVPPGGRQTVYLNGEFGMVGGAAAAFNSSVPIVAERSIYWGQGRVEGTNVMGSSTLANTWSLPEGVAGGNFDTFLLLGNPGPIPSSVELSLQIEGYGQVTLPAAYRKTVPGYGRLTLYMPQVLREVEQAEGLPPGTFASASFATTVRVRAGSPIVAEHAVYWLRDGTNFWRGGAAAFGTPR